MSPARFAFTARVWEHDGPGAWHFVDLPREVADDVDEQFGAGGGPFGSIRVEVTIGATTWSTSLFPDRARGTYLLPVKRSVRAAERLAAGSTATVALTVVRA